MLTEKDYCDYDTCVALKELGYNEKSNWWFSKVLIEEYDQMQLVHICDNPAHLNYDSWGICPKDFVIRPTMWETQKWLREEKNLHIEVRWYSNLWYEYEVKEAECNVIALGSAYPTYEETLSTAIDMAIEHLKKIE